MASADTHIADWLGRVRAEYLEMPGLQLTMRQARHFWGLDDVTCSALFTLLVDAKFLKQNPAGAYIRADGN